MSVLKAKLEFLSSFRKSSFFVEKRESCASWWFRFTVSAHVTVYLSGWTYFLCEDPQTSAEFFLFASSIRIVGNSLSTGLLTSSFLHTPSSFQISPPHPEESELLSATGGAHGYAASGNIYNYYWGFFQRRGWFGGMKIPEVINQLNE